MGSFVLALHVYMDRKAWEKRIAAVGLTPGNCIISVGVAEACALVKEKYMERQRMHRELEDVEA